MPQRRRRLGGATAQDTGAQGAGRARLAAERKPRPLTIALWLAPKPCSRPSRRTPLPVVRTASLHPRLRAQLPICANTRRLRLRHAVRGPSQGTMCDVRSLNVRQYAVKKNANILPAIRVNVAQSGPRGVKIRDADAHSDTQAPHRTSERISRSEPGARNDVCDFGLRGGADGAV